MLANSYQKFIIFAYTLIFIKSTVAVYHGIVMASGGNTIVHFKFIHSAIYIVLQGTSEMYVVCTEYLQKTQKWAFISTFLMS